MLTLAGETVPRDTALGYLRTYARDHAATVLYYDYGGDPARPPEASNGVEMADVARLVVIEARLGADDVPLLLLPVERELWEAVSRTRGFEDLDDDPRADPDYRAADRLYGAYTERRGLGPAKATKLLHLKRPRLVPVVDSVVTRAYEAAARSFAAEVGNDVPLYWAAIWRDARANLEALSYLAERLAAGEQTRLLAALSPLRLLDVLVWSHFRDRPHRPRG